MVQPAADGVEVPKELLRRMFEAGPDLQGVLDLEGRFLAANGAWARVLGWRTDELLGRCWQDLAHPDDVAPTAKEQEAWRAREHVAEGFMQRLRTTVGEHRWVAWTIVRDPGSERVLVLGRDATRAVADGEGVGRAQQELQDFIFLTVHDLRSPLSTIGLQLTMAQKSEERLDRASASLATVQGLFEGVAELACLGEADVRPLATDLRPVADDLVKTLVRELETQGSRLDQATAAVTTLKGLVEGLAEMATLGDAGVDGAATDLGRVAQELVKGFAGELERRDAVVAVEDLPMCRIAPGHALHVLQNLVLNAIRHNEVRPPRVLLKGIEAHDGLVHLVCEDNGPGIDQRYWDDVFRVGTRLNATAEGTGMGLALTRRIVERFGGWVKVRGSTADGTVIEVALPAAEDAARDGSVRMVRGPPQVGQANATGHANGHGTGRADDEA